MKEKPFTANEKRKKNRYHCEKSNQIPYINKQFSSSDKQLKRCASLRVSNAKICDTSFAKSTEKREKKLATFRACFCFSTMKARIRKVKWCKKDVPFVLEGEIERKCEKECVCNACTMVMFSLLMLSLV